jgi:hypothetical protein
VGQTGRADARPELPLAGRLPARQDRADRLGTDGHRRRREEPARGATRYELMGWSSSAGGSEVDGVSSLDGGLTGKPISSLSEP